MVGRFQSRANVFGDDSTRPVAEAPSNVEHYDAIINRSEPAEVYSAAPPECATRSFVFDIGF